MIVEVNQPIEISLTSGRILFSIGTEQTKSNLGFGRDKTVNNQV
jgi:hypothetical protein